MTDRLPPVTSDLAAAFQRWTAVLESSKPVRFKNVQSLVEFRPAAESPFCLRLSGDGIETIYAGHPVPTSVIHGTVEAIDRVLGEGEDITHQIASGGLTVVAGSYDDVILLSRMLRHLNWDREESE